MRAIDTNVLVRLLARDDAAQVAAAEDFVRGGAWVSHLVLMEAVWVLESVYEVEPPQIVAAIEMLLDHDTLVLQDAEVVASSLAIHRRRPKVGFSDCLILEVARKAGHIPLGTFDRNLAKVAGAAKL
ncbi:MAG: type II toxin-antitoxin system VapC family toxin [Deltaproteobacteria bacterium]|nr:type II toxin-antitoxin system VapC family toxin [Deltaproteobacteria bacterium]